MGRLFEAVKAGRVDEVMRLVGEDPTLLRARDTSGASAILTAVYHRQPAVAEALARVATLDLFEASALGRVDRVREILAADPSQARAYAPDGFTAVALSAFFGHAEAAAALIAAGADVNAAAQNPLKVTALHAAVAGGNLDIVRAVLDAGADPNAPQQAGFRPIHEAGTNAKRDLAELLLAHGADPALPNDAGLTAGDLARQKGHGAFADWLANRR